MPFSNTVIDLSHHNGVMNFSSLPAGGVVGIIHKATQGTTGSDAMYQTHMAGAKAAGLLWGAYHFATGSDGVAQADAFLKFVKPTPQTLMVLDFEPNPQGTSMGLEDARAFVTHVKAVTGIFPGIYGGHYLKELLGGTEDPTFQNCWLWLAQYGPTPVVPPNWANYTLWQYSDGTTAPHIPIPDLSVPAIDHCDHSNYIGTPEQLKAKWLTGSLL
jgi:lysozyme